MLVWCVHTVRKVAKIRNRYNQQSKYQDINNTNDPQKKNRLRTVSKNISLEGLNHFMAPNLRKMTANNPNIYLVSINSYKKFDQNLSICSQDIEGKRNYGVNQGP